MSQDSINFLVDKNLATAETLPSACYTAPSFLETEKQKVFWKSWQMVGNIAQVSEPGTYFTVDLLGQPLLIVRTKEKGIKAFHNVCRHRASVVATGAGCAKVFQCPYHGWTYDLEGKLQGQREFEGVENWDKAKNGLPEVRLESWGPLLFANLEAVGPSLAEMISGIPEAVSQAGIDLASYRFLVRKEYVVECNWKVYVDNYLEGYHIPLVHPALHRLLDYSRYEVKTHRYYSNQLGPLREGAETALYYWLFPNFMINVYPDNMSTNLILPMGPERTLTIFEWFLPPQKPGAARTSMEATMAFSDQVQVEDIAICESVQKGLRSVSYERGRYCVKRENGVHHFHQLLGEFLSLPHPTPLS